MERKKFVQQENRDYQWRCIFLLLNYTFTIESPESLMGTFHYFGRVTDPKILVFTMWFTFLANCLIFLTPLSWWNHSALIARGAIISFSPTWFSRCIIQGVACNINIVAASFPSWLLEIVDIIMLSFCSTIKNSLNLMCWSSKDPEICSFHINSSLANSWQEIDCDSIHCIYWIHGWRQKDHK